jgi:hypothetical protein
MDLPVMDDEASAMYSEEIPLLLHDAAELMSKDREAAVQLTMARWDSAMARHYRRRHWKSQTAALVFSVISYECRTCLHECYSDVWTELLGSGGPLRQIYSLSAQDVCFLSLWHVIQKAPSQFPDARFDLFHGHVFALHPALRLLIRTAMGKQVLGDFVTEASDLSRLPEPQEMFARVRKLPKFRRLLQAADLAVYVYTSARQDLALERNVEQATSHELMELNQARQHERNLGRSRRRFRR